MSDFKIKVTADLDTSQVEAKLMALQNRKITIQANVNGNGLSNMNNSLQQIQNNANRDPANIIQIYSSCVIHTFPTFAIIFNIFQHKKGGLTTNFP